MINQPHSFNDVKGTPWTLTALALAGTQFALESVDASICVVAQKAVLTLDETNPKTPFALELDDNCHLAIDTPNMEKLDEFLQKVAALQLLGEAA
ncbi:MAG TPA: hypothetical protein VL995_21090 [Cellvibrio sp.]|nr:hypothetical protein [Cellvibrio sp.]